MHALLRPISSGPAFDMNPLIHVESGIRWENVAIYISMAEAFQRAEFIVSLLVLVSHWRGFYVLRRFPA